MDLSDFQIFTLPVTAYAQNCRMIISKTEQKAVVIDPGAEARGIYDFAREKGADICAVLLTHGHLDHAGAAAALSKLCNVTVTGPAIGDADMIRNIGRQSALLGLPPCDSFSPSYVKDGDVIHLFADPQYDFHVLATPGHTEGSVCYLWADYLFSGDTLFNLSVGRCDLPGGDERKLRASLSRLKELDDAVKLCPGHGPDSNMGFEKRNNPYLA